jgi:multiple sugar transport system ATP-binding protein
MNFLDAAAIGMNGAKTVGIRPEHLVVSPEKGDWKGTLVHSEHLGADTNLYVDTEKAGTITVRAFGEVRHPNDSVVYVSPSDAQLLYRFDDAGNVIR